MKKYSELGDIHRCEPCEEYPGSWMIFINGEVPMDEETHQDFEAAYLAAKREWETSVLEDPPIVAVCWRASDNDPRIGQVWFTSYYRHGAINQYGQYIT